MRNRNHRKKIVPQKSQGLTKLVRVDGSTQVEVPIEMSDKEARDRFYFRHGILTKPPVKAYQPKEAAEDIPPEIPLEDIPEDDTDVE